MGERAAVRNRRYWMLAALVGLSALVPPRAQAERASPPSRLAGTWRSTFGGATSTLNLTQIGPHLVGTYISSTSTPGALAGRVQGLTVHGRWTDATSSGGFVLTFSADGRAFRGTWGNTPESESDGGPWVGQRM